MLVLGRKKDQKIHIGDVVVTIVHIGNGSVRLGIEAPASVNIRRGELPAEAPQEPVRQEHGVSCEAV